MIRRNLRCKASLFCSLCDSVFVAEQGKVVNANGDRGEKRRLKRVLVQRHSWERCAASSGGDIRIRGPNALPKRKVVRFEAHMQGMPVVSIHP